MSPMATVFVAPVFMTGYGIGNVLPAGNELSRYKLNAPYNIPSLNPFHNKNCLHAGETR